MDLLRSLITGTPQGYPPDPPDQPLDRAAVEDQLKGINEASLAELLVFKRGVENMLRNTTYYAQFETPRQVIPAKSLTRDEVFTRFDLKSVIDGQGQHVIPKWDPPGAPGICSEWLARALNIGVDVFRPKYSDITAIINLVIMDVIHDLPQFQVLDHFKVAGAAPERSQSIVTFTPGDPYVPTPKRLKIRAYKQQPIATLVGSEGDLAEIVGSFDAAFSCGYLMGNTQSDVTIIETHLIVLKVQSGRRMMTNQVHDPTNQLCAYLAMIQRGQANWYKEVDACRSRFGLDGTGYGVVSDGVWCRFIEVNTDNTVRFGDVLGIRSDIHKVLQYLRHIFTAIVADYRPRS